MIFNNIDFSTLFTVEKIQVPMLPSILNSYIEVPKMRGSKFVRNRLDMKAINVDIRLIEDSADDVATKVRTLAGQLYTTEPKKLILDDSGLYETAVLDGQIDIDKLLYTGFAILTFICPDPLSYKDKPSVSIVDTAALSIGGTYETLPKFTISVDSTISYIKISHTESGKYVHVEHAFVSGDVVEIDFSDKWKVRKNDVVIAEDVYIESDYFALNVGVNNVSVLPTGLDVVMEYKERWL